MGKVWDKTGSDQTPLGLTDVRQFELMLQGTNLGSHARALVSWVSLRSLVTSSVSPVSLVVAIPVCAAWAGSWKY